MDQTLRLLCAWDEYMQLPDGQWFPKKVTQHWYSGHGKNALLSQVHIFTVEKIEQNPKVDDAAFSTDPRSLPPGTLLNDQIRDRQTVIGGAKRN